MTHLFKVYIASVILSLSLSLSISTQTWAAPWTKIHEKVGIRVYERESTLGDLPDFKAISKVKASIFDLIAVLQDINRRDEWVHRCEASKIIKRYGEFEILLYHKTDSPWPISDRDATIKTSLYEIKREREYLAYFKGVKSRSIPKKNGAIRLPHIEGYYHLQYVSAHETKVTYFVHLDPGGSLPKWLVKIATRDLPTKTIIGLRKQIKKTKRSGVYQTFHKRWNPAVRTHNVPQSERPPHPGEKLLRRLGLK